MQECADSVMAVSMWGAGSRERGTGMAGAYMLLGISMRVNGTKMCAVVKEGAFMCLGTSTKVSSALLYSQGGYLMGDLKADSQAQRSALL